MKEKTFISEDQLTHEFTGHDHYVYNMSKVYGGSGYVHLVKAVSGTLVGSKTIQSIAFHIDDIDAVCEALQKLKVR